MKLPQRERLDAGETYEVVAVSFVRIVTNPRIYRQPTPRPLALATIETIAAHPRCRVATPGAGHLDEVARLCRATQAAGKLVAAAQHAALAVAEGCTWVTRDADFGRFKAQGLRWEHLVLG